jgi:hypothetical protein
MSDRDQMLFVSLVLPVVLALLVWGWTLMPKCETKAHQQITRYGYVEVQVCTGG